MEWERLEVVVSEAPQPNPAVATVGLDPKLGTVLNVTNPSPTVPLRITSLDVSVSDMEISLFDLTYENPDVQSLPWEPVIVSATHFAPGETKVFDIPDGAPKPTAFCYLRSLYTDEAAILPEMGLVQSIAAPQHTCVVTADGDVDGDGLTKTADLLALLSNWGECSPEPPAPCLGDLDCSGAVGTEDLLTLLANWG